MLTFISLKIKHHINELAANDFLKLIKAILPKPNNIKKSKHYNIFEGNLKHVCTKCRETLTLTNNEKINVNKIYMCHKCDTENVNFITFSIKKQIEFVLKRPCILKQIT